MGEGLCFFEMLGRVLQWVSCLGKGWKGCMTWGVVIGSMSVEGWFFEV